MRPPSPPFIAITVTLTHPGCLASIGEASSQPVRGCGIMADLRLSGDELRPIVEQVVRAVLDELSCMNLLVHGKLALTEEQAADLLDLNPWQTA